jgi:hypothetical protein
MTEHGSDQPILKHIERLVREEHDLYGHEKPSDRDRQRLKQLEVELELDQCWDLLRQRRPPVAELGPDLDRARTLGGRDENYEQ